MTMLAKITADAGNRSAALAGVRDVDRVWMFSFGDALGKFIVATYTVGQFLLLRAAASLVLLSPAIWQIARRSGSIQRPGLQLRGVALSTLEVARSSPRRSISRSPMSSPTTLRRRFSSPRLPRSSSARRSAGGAGARFMSASSAS
jgi:hypothetical protein